MKPKKAGPESKSTYEKVTGPVRRIKKNHLVVTGRLPTRKSGSQEAESLLERDYLLLLENDDAVARMQVQPVRLPVPGVPQGYVPDVLVEFHDSTRIPELTEVKFLADLEEKKKEYAPKFAAAKQYASERGWRFVLKDEKQIRGHRLENIKFFRGYAENCPTTEEIDAVHQWLRDAGGASTSETLLELHAQSETRRARWLTVLWGMVAHRYLHVDMDAHHGVDVAVSLPANKR